MEGVDEWPILMASCDPHSARSMVAVAFRSHSLCRLPLFCIGVLLTGVCNRGGTSMARLLTVICGSVIWMRVEVANPTEARVCCLYADFSTLTLLT